MARILYSSIASELRGSIQGNTFQRNSSGTIVKQRNLQRFSSSVNQGLAQGRMTDIATSWSLLNPSDREDWNNAGLVESRTDFYGRTKSLNGFQWYMLCNQNRLLTSQALLVSPPASFSPIALPSGNSLLSATEFSFTFNSSQDCSLYNVIVMASAPAKSQAFKTRASALLVANVTGNPITTINFTTAYTTAWGIDATDLYSLTHLQWFLNIFTIVRASGISSAYYQNPWPH